MEWEIQAAQFRFVCVYEAFMSDESGRQDVVRNFRMGVEYRYEYASSVLHGLKVHFVITGTA